MHRQFSMVRLSVAKSPEMRALGVFRGCIEDILAAYSVLMRVTILSARLSHHRIRIDIVSGGTREEKRGI